MAVIRIPVYVINKDIFLHCIFSYMVPNHSPQFSRIKEWNPVFGAPDKVNINLDKWPLKNKKRYNQI